MVQVWCWTIACWCFKFVHPGSQNFSSCRLFSSLSSPHLQPWRRAVISCTIHLNLWVLEVPFLLNTLLFLSFKMFHTAAASVNLARTVIFVLCWNQFRKYWLLLTARANSDPSLTSTYTELKCTWSSNSQNKDGKVFQVVCYTEHTFSYRIPIFVSLSFVKSFFCKALKLSTWPF